MADYVSQLRRVGKGHGEWRPAALVGGGSELRPAAFVGARSCSAAQRSSAWLSSAQMCCLSLHWLPAWLRSQALQPTALMLTGTAAGLTRTLHSVPILSDLQVCGPLTMSCTRKRSGRAPRPTHEQPVASCNASGRPSRTAPECNPPHSAARSVK